MIVIPGHYMVSSTKLYRINDQTIDLGVFEINKNKMLSIVQMKNTQYVHAFAITLEKKGGNSSPNMDAMYVKGDL